jgi:hypothetical protein
VGLGVVVGVAVAVGVWVGAGEGVAEAVGVLVGVAVGEGGAVASATVVGFWEQPINSRALIHNKVKYSRTRVCTPFLCLGWCSVRAFGVCRFNSLPYELLRV